MPSIFRRFLILFVAPLLSSSEAQVVINEISSAASERNLQWSADGTPRLGSGIPWNAANFTDASWTSGNLPAGWGSMVSTDLQTAMLNKTPSLYLRKSFTVTPTQAASGLPMVLQVEINDGFVAYINGVEVARTNCGPPKHFIYAAQPAYNATTTSGIREFTLAAANTLLVSGTNVLAIQAHNSDIGTTFRVNAGLKLLTSSQTVMLTKALYNFENANGASKTHTNTNGTVTNTSSGTPPAGGWLATAANPTSDNTWTSLQIITSEAQGNGVGGSGGLKYSVTQSGTNRGAVLHAPAVSMAAAWSPGSLSPDTLSTTTIGFRYRTSGDLQFGFRLDPVLNLAASSVDGFRVIGLPAGGAAAYDWTTTIAGLPAAATGGYVRRTINASGAGSSATSGSINSSNYEILNSVGTTSGVLTAKEDNAAGIGPGGSTGVFSFTFDTMPATIDTLSFGIKNIAVNDWNPPNITVADFQRSRVSFRWKLPAGKLFTFYLEPTSGGTTATRANLGTVTGTGAWETYSLALGSAQDAEALRTKLNTQGTAGKKVKFTGAYAGTVFSNGQQVLIDDLRVFYQQPGTEADEDPARTFGSAGGASTIRTIDGAGGFVDLTFGTMGTAVTFSHEPGLTGFGVRVSEDNTAGAGNSGSTGYLRCEVTDPPDTGAPWSFSLPGFKVQNWTPGGISVANLADVAVQVAAKIPAGVTVQLFAEPVGGSTANRANLGTLTGNSTWQTIAREFATAVNVEAFRAALNATSTTAFQLTFAGPSNAPAGDIIALDDPVLLRWRTYQVTLDEGNNQQRFLDYLNQQSSVSFIPTFVKNTIPAAGATFLIDDFQVVYEGLDPGAVESLVAPGSSAGTWKYFVGLAEPSGGVYDPALVTNGFPAPPGQEGDYDNPQAFRDWVELRNLGGTSVSLANWSLTDDPDLPGKWRFPVGASIPANGYLIVMCDERDEANGTATYLHTNFSLSSNGEYIGLFNSAGVLQSEVTGLPDQDSFHTWGRNPAGTADYGFLDSATPRAANAGNFSSGRVKTPDFFKSDGVTNFPGGFYVGAQTLVIKTTTVGATIRYTTDGSEPTETTGTPYTAPIPLTPPVDHKSGLVIRARAFLNGQVASKTKTHTYLLDLDSRLRGVPALLFSGDAGRNFYLPMGIMAISGGNYGPGIWQQGGPDSYNIPINRGDPTERLISAEWYYSDGRDGWREDVGVRISSSPFSRPRLILNQTGLSPWIADHTQKPSFNLYWRGDYGNSEVKDNSLIPDNGVNNYARLRIRAGKNDINNPFVIDEVGRRLYRDMGWVEPTGTLNTLYVNGSFKGLYNTTERLRGEMFQAHYRTSYEFDVRYIGEQVDGDATFWNQMQAALNQNQATPANYQNAQNYVDVTNVADCFLFWIYINMDDWPGNNWAAQRERSPAGRYRMVAWDVEAAFGRFGKAVNFNTLDTNLLNASSECGDIFKRLYASPEFKLLFADRVNKHMFNGGVLDDRGASSHFLQLKNSFKAQAQPLLSFLGYGTFDEGWFNNHVNPATGRRAYLLGTAAGSFSSRGLWPATLPPTFSQFGGNVPANYQLVIAHTAPAGSVLYYTTDGSDPRLSGGGVSSSALTYTGPVTLSNLVTILARVRNANGEWSPLTEAFFAPAAVPPEPNTLVISEIMYHPPDASAAEQAATFTNPDDFEFVRLTTIGAAPLDLRNLQFTAGITFNFGAGNVLALAPGASVLVVKNLDAFHVRYGTSYDALIAGEYAGSLDNGGEPMVLERTGASPLIIKAFTFGDSRPWPETADGYGPSLMLANPASAPDHANPASWIASAQPGGLPGGTPRTLTYAVWKQLVFDSFDAANAAISGPTIDIDRDGLPNAAEYALGCVPTYPDSTVNAPLARIENLAGQNYLTFEYRLMSGASEASVTPEISANLSSWLSGAGNVVTLSGPIANANGSATWKVRDANAATSSDGRYLRLKVLAP